MMTRRAGAVLALAAAASLSSLPASAAPPVGGCPGPFTLLTYQQQLALAAEILPDRTPEQIAKIVEGGLAAYDKNSDRLLCVHVHPIRPSQERPFVNLIDNVAQPLR